MRVHSILPLEQLRSFERRAHAALSAATDEVAAELRAATAHSDDGIPAGLVAYPFLLNGALADSVASAPPHRTFKPNGASALADDEQRLPTALRLTVQHVTEVASTRLQRRLRASTPTAFG